MPTEHSSEPTRGKNLTAKPIHVAIYTRYSSDLQRPTSNEDQIRNCRAGAAEKGYVVIDDYIRSDSAVSGRSLEGRDGLKELIQIAKTKECPFQGILIDDTSRFGRYLPDVVREIDVLHHHGIFVYFVSQRMDSRDPVFQMGLLFASYTDQQYVSGLSQKVHRGQHGRVLNGFSPGGRCYGYKNVPVEDASRRGDYGRPAVIGVHQEVIPEEAAVVRRIFEMYADGASYVTIAKTLNRDGILSPQPAKKRKIRAWCQTAIREMLLNERYRGVRVWNREQCVLNPETGKTEVRSHPESEWVRFEDESLRIVSEELWRAVRDQNTRVREKYGSKRLGGMNRTHNSRRYIFSGLLVCGLCEANITIVSGKAPYARYGCPNHRYRGVCKNGLTIRQAKLEQHLIGALTKNLFKANGIETYVKSFRASLAHQLEQRMKHTREAEAKSGELNQEKQELTKKAKNVVDAIVIHGISSLLSEQLTAIETRLEFVKRALNSVPEPEPPTFSDEEIRAFLLEKMTTLRDVLLSDPVTARHQLQKHIDRLVLTPKSIEGEPFYEVSGDIGIFVGENDDVLQNNSLEGIAQQYNKGSEGACASGTASWVLPRLMFSARLLSLEFTERMLRQPAAWPRPGLREFYIPLLQAHLPSNLGGTAEKLAFLT